MNVSKFLMIAVGVVFILASIYNVLKVFGTFTAAAPFDISSEQADIGVFDPTVEFNRETGQGYMAYTALYKGSGVMMPPLASVHLAVTKDRGDEWRFIKKIFESKPGVFTYRDESGNMSEIEGVWRYEMPSLVYTPGDPNGAWKIFAYRYFWNGNMRLARQSGTIVFKRTNDPAGDWSEEQWFFAADSYNPPAPYNRLVKTQVNRLDPRLQDVIAYGDPGAFYANGFLYVTLSAYTGISVPDRLVLLASPDYGASWQYLGSPLSARDFTGQADVDRFSGAQMIQKDGRAYLLLSLGNQRNGGTGVRIYPFADLNGAAMARAQNGALILAGQKLIAENQLTALGGGAADYDELSKSGLLMSLMLPAQEKPFRIRALGHDFLN